MEFLELRLSTQGLARQRTFYAETLGLELLEATSQHFTVQVGSSLLRFNLSKGDVEPYHFAFNIPKNKLTEAKVWLLERVKLLEQEGQTRFSSESWNAEQVYFSDADGNILEFIARHELRNASREPFSSRHILNVSEIGYVVPNVTETIASLNRLGLTAYRKADRKFAAVGDAQGLLIVAETGRPWFPTEVKASVAALELTLRSTQPFTYTEPGLPYRLCGIPGHY